MSPTVCYENGYRYFFFSREESRKHVHISSGEGEAKYWLEPTVELAECCKYSQKNLKHIEQFIREHHDEICTAWNQHFNC